MIHGAALMGGGDDHRVGCSPSPTQDASTSVIYEAHPGISLCGMALLMYPVRTTHGFVPGLKVKLWRVILGFTFV
jgi:hypothetical protein